MATTAPDPSLFNFLIPGRDDPFYGCCLMLYRPATEAMSPDDEEVSLPSFGNWTWPDP